MFKVIPRQALSKTSLILLIPLLLIGFIIVFSLVWAGISSYSSSISGWKKLAMSYPDNSELISEKKISVGFARFNNSNYRGGALNIEAFPGGLRLSMSWFSKFGHSPIFIPWTDLESTGSGSEQIFTAKKDTDVQMKFFDLSDWILQQKNQYQK